MSSRSPWILLALLLCVACQTVKTVDSNTTNNAKLYKQAIQNAMYPEESKVDTSLVAVNNQNRNLVWKEINGEEYILVVTWKQNISYYEPYIDSAYYNTGNYPIWVTTAPELLQRMKQEKVKDTDLRLKQLLGLPPNSIYNYFIEFWVKPGDLFRPCPDNEITDKQCDLCFPSNTDASHISWINNNRIDRYYQCDLFNQYPWTQLGYTYDWNPNNKTHIGLSEFVIGKDKNIKVKAIYTTKDYLTKSIPSQNN
ncbi:MAG: hypothetical protein ACEPOZ_02005 [Marinifilaceae bacterium]